MKKIVIIDGQGGRLGKLLVEETRARMPQTHILVIGTNGVATSTMQKAGADQRPPERTRWCGEYRMRMQCWAPWVLSYLTPF